MIIEYRMDGDGLCHTPCPNGIQCMGVPCMVNSTYCHECAHYFGDQGGVVKCNYRGEPRDENL